MVGRIAEAEQWSSLAPERDLLRSVCLPSSACVAPQLMKRSMKGSAYQMSDKQLLCPPTYTHTRRPGQIWPEGHTARFISR